MCLKKAKTRPQTVGKCDLTIARKSSLMDPRSSSQPVISCSPQHLRRITQCPDLMIQCPGLIIQCPGIITSHPENVKMRPEIAPSCHPVMRVCAPRLKIFPVLYGTIQLCHRVLITVPQCPGIT